MLLLLLFFFYLGGGGNKKKKIKVRFRFGSGVAHVNKRKVISHRCGRIFF